MLQMHSRKLEVEASVCLASRARARLVTSGCGSPSELSTELGLTDCLAMCQGVFSLAERCGVCICTAQIEEQQPVHNNKPTASRKAHGKKGKSKKRS